MPKAKAGGVPKAKALTGAERQARCRAKAKQEKEAMINQLAALQAENAFLKAALELRKPEPDTFFVSKEVPKDGNCLFHAIYHCLSTAERLPHFNRIRKLSTVPHIHMRKEIIRFMERNQMIFCRHLKDKGDKQMGKYIKNLKKDGVWADYPVLEAAACFYGFNFYLFKFEHQDPYGLKYSVKDSGGKEGRGVYTFAFHLENEHYSPMSRVQVTQSGEQ
mmetsp:Transcript_4515/g.12641  ORF Transcript_4515/g.12641 Transcript_4515/m.12641 type:complete len:219 (+) Transcript_4515:132-788(+)|eukprot:CAMPEP_0119124056 /NCGR_PEP_ID=MMETSP1310-20130426/3789_1 /TAXON_ID=464262 /ORGANISM="Genus nov. species nov., Strain RCC2339" /LENGTH=218 /DNA_ID=CAMNT_0007113945 /DNA_START=119 /DNA_END=775 /DNA_ORIENTATION=+